MKQLMLSNEAIARGIYEIAEQCGTVKAANVVLLGVLAKQLPFTYEEWMDALEKNVKPRFLEINKEAFHRGYEL